MQQKMPKGAFAAAGLVAVAALVSNASAATVTNDKATVSYDFQTFRGDGFRPNPESTQLDSDDVIYRRTLTSSEEFGDTLDVNEYARGEATSASAINASGIWSIQIGSGADGDNAIVIQPRAGAQTDFAPGALAFKFTNSGTGVITSISVDAKLYVNNKSDRSSAFDLVLITTGTEQPLNDFSSTGSSDTSSFTLQPGAASGTATGLSIPPGESFYLEYRGDLGSGGGSFDHFALGSMSMTATFAAAPVPEPLAALAGMGLLGVVTARRLRLA